MQHNLIDFAAELDLDEAAFEANLGFPREARDHAEEALKLVPNVPEIEGFAALDLAGAGDPVRAEFVIDNASAEFPLHTLLNAALIPSAYLRRGLRFHWIVTTRRRLFASWKRYGRRTITPSWR